MYKDETVQRIKKELPFERTLVLIKPDAVQRGLVGKVISRFEDKGLQIVGLKLMNVNDAIIDSHYGHLKEKPFFKTLTDFMQSSPLVAMVWQGVDAVEAVRLIVGTTTSRKADAGSIRGDFGMGYSANIIHASDSIENANVEVNRFFNNEEILDYDKTEFLHIYSPELNR
jgi:nucleoside-diphosphate kinase